MKMFIKDFEYLQQSFQQQLRKVEAQENDLRIRFQKLSRICRNILIKLSNELNENPFPDKDCEIYFFKRIKAEIMGNYIFYQKVHWLHTGYYKKSAILERKRLEKERINIERFFWENQVYYTYYRNECTHHDDMYFVRGQYDEKICPPVNHFDPHFSTSFDGMLAKMKARELLLEYIEERLK
ncbi:MULTISPECIES: RteC domain-containing protein, partial [Niastella]